MTIVIVGDRLTNRQLIIELLKIKEVVICGQIPDQKEKFMELKAGIRELKAITIDDCNNLNKETQMKYRRPGNMRYNAAYYRQRPKHRRYYL
jgi:hypothetical protein